MKRLVYTVAVLAIGFGMGAVVPRVLAAPKVGDSKFENEFMKKFVPTPEKPLTLRVAGADLVVTGTVEVQDDYITFQLRSKDPATAAVRVRDIAAVMQPTN